ncbi:AAA family ATPase [Patescibacteria group bacterium]|nr:AAA family ATPase [Patescibacteria group bacterium]MBU1885015.1 AAA family ATPase [Patescibacteria group bacterium]
MSKNTVKTYRRQLKIPLNYSFFLFGPRGVGKTTLLNHLLPPKKTLRLDLLDNELEYKLSTNKTAFKEIISSLTDAIEWIYIDEIQKIPALLDEVHQTLESNKKIKFALTGSSARKLKAGQANLLAGRAFTLKLYPLSIRELETNFHLSQALQFGTLPKIFEFTNDQDKRAFLAAYVNTYLQEEIVAEGVTRQLQSFKNFLQIAAFNNGEIVSFSNIAQDTGIDARSIKSYYEILEDTLLGFRLYPYKKSIRKKQREKPKFYFFDTGVVRALQGLSSIKLAPKTIEYGKAFEHLLINEILKENHYRKTDFQFSYFTTPNSEVDLIIKKPSGETLLIEIKSTNNIRSKHFTTLKSLLPDIPQSKGIVISREAYKRKTDQNILICPWQNAITEIYS